MALERRYMDVKTLKWLGCDFPVFITLLGLQSNFFDAIFHASFLCLNFINFMLVLSKKKADACFCISPTRFKKCEMRLLEKFESTLNRQSCDIFSLVQLVIAPNNSSFIYFLYLFKHFEEIPGPTSAIIEEKALNNVKMYINYSCLLYTSPSPRDS